MTARHAREAWKGRAARIAVAAMLAVCAPTPSPVRASEVAYDPVASECAAKKKPGKAKSRAKKSSKPKTAPADDGANGIGRVTKESVAPRPRPTPGANPPQLGDTQTAPQQPAEVPAHPETPPPAPTPVQTPPAQSPAPSSAPAPGGAFVPARMDDANPNRQPDYPMESRAAGEEGRVVLWVEILADGSVGRALVATTSLSPRLDAAALAAARNWHYIPATRGGVPVTSGANVLVDFRLSN